MPVRTTELGLTALLVAVALILLAILHNPIDSPGSANKWADIGTKFAFALLVAVVVRWLNLLFTYLEGRSPSATFGKLGMLRVIDPLTDEALKQYLSDARELRILKTWFPENADIEDGLKSAITRHNPASVKLLLAHPDSKMLAQRSEAANQPHDHGGFRVLNALQKISDWVGGHEGVKVEVRLYDSWPGCPVIWCDDKVFMGFYFRGQSSSQWPWVAVQKGSKLDRILREKQFEELWNLPKNIRFSNADQIGKWLAHRGTQVPVAPASNP